MASSLHSPMFMKRVTTWRVSNYLSLEDELLSHRKGFQFCPFLRSESSEAVNDTLMHFPYKLADCKERANPSNGVPMCSPKTTTYFPAHLYWEACHPYVTKKPSYQINVLFSCALRAPTSFSKLIFRRCSPICVGCATELSTEGWKCAERRGQREGFLIASLIRQVLGGRGRNRHCYRTELQRMSGAQELCGEERLRPFVTS